MTVTANELARRLRTARQALSMTERDAAQYVSENLGKPISCPAIAQMETGQRAVSLRELQHLARAYGRDMREFLSDSFQTKDTLSVLLRTHPGILSRSLLHALRQALAVGRELSNLEQRLALDRNGERVPRYAWNAPQTRGDAVTQGERMAEAERRRLDLGTAPVPDVTDLLERQGMRTVLAALPDDVSGLMLQDAAAGILVAVNAGHHPLRRRFSFAHEYAHALLDSPQRGTVSRTRDSANLPEARANAFAASFLMPETGVERFMQGMAKGRTPHEQAFFGEAGTARAAARHAPGNRDVTLYDAALLAHYFKVSRAAAIYRLKRLRLINHATFAALQERERNNAGAAIAQLLDLPEPDPAEARNRVQRRFLALAVEAYRRETITRGKLRELAALVNVDNGRLERVLKEAGIHRVAIDALVPRF